MANTVDTTIRTFDGKNTKDLFNAAAISKGTATKAELRQYAEVLALIINGAVLEGNFAPIVQVAEETSVNAREYITEVVNAYTAAAREECFKALAQTEDPMLEGVKQLTRLSRRLRKRLEKTRKKFR